MVLVHIYVSMQEFVHILSISQCHKLIFEAYARAGGIESAREIIEIPDDEPSDEPQQSSNKLVCVWKVSVNAFPQ